MGRFPHALVSCASAHESALKSAPSLWPSDSLPLVKLYDRVVALHPGLAMFDEGELTAFRKARNTYVHKGFAFDDDAAAAELLLKIGLPYLRACYDALFGFDLLDCLIVEYGEQLRIALNVYQRARNIPDLDFGYCFSAFGHLIQWSAGQSQLVSWERDASIHADETGTRFEKCKRQRRELELTFGAAWFFDCPICCESEMLVGELDETCLGVGKVALKRAACPSCRLVVREKNPCLADALCHTQLAEEQEKILREFGITSGSPLLPGTAACG
jgi:hypothetical protein